MSTYDSMSQPRVVQGVRKASEKKKIPKIFNFALAKHWIYCIIEGVGKKGERTNIEERLREAIISSPMSRYRISKLSGVGQAELSLFVNRKRTLTLATAAKVADVLRLDLKSVKKGR